MFYEKIKFSKKEIVSWVLKKTKFRWKIWLFEKNEIFQNFEISRNQIDSFWNSKFSTKNLEKWTPHENLESDGNRNYIITWCSYSAKIKLQYMKNTFHVAHFDINMVLSTRNMFTEVRVPKSRGLIGTRFTYAPIWQACGKPSTKFPHRGLVECTSTPRMPYKIFHWFLKRDEF